MLPERTSVDFPEKLREAREAKGLTYTELAERAGISAVMPPRYENRSRIHFTPPSQRTWHKLNEALFPSAGTTEPVAPRLNEATMDELVAELKRRGATAVTVTV